jgi:hypothetical protein
MRRWWPADYPYYPKWLDFGHTQPEPVSEHYYDHTWGV